jgi:hypothetical protein
VSDSESEYMINVSAAAYITISPSES